MFRNLGFATASVVVVALFLNVPGVTAQVESGRGSRPRITQAIDEANRVVLLGNLRPEASLTNDRGAVPDNFPMQHMLLQLKRSPAQEQALLQFIDELHTKGSPNFHHWLTAQEFGDRFGLAQPDLDAITAWLQSHGFQVNVVYPSGMLIDFSGTAGQVRGAFQTEIHHLAVRGEAHIANMREPRIPAALAPVVAGVVSLHDFRPHTMHKMRQPRAQFTFPDPSGGNAYAVVPADLAKIYNLNPLFSAGTSGQGQTIVLIEDTDVFTASDWTTFRQTFGLSGYTSASFTQVHPPAPNSLPGNNCGAPGVIAPNDAEAILDAEWASASAPSAAIEMAACADTTTTFGGLIAIQNLINASTPPPAIISISYGQCETVNGAAANGMYNSAYQQAVTEGVSVFVAAGDSGAAGCDNSVAEATHGIGVNAFASTPNNVAVGGTDFSDTFSGTSANYWNSANTSAFGSALSYIPEIPWNDSCAGALLSSYLGYSPTYGSTSLCNDPLFGSLFMTTVGGGGGPSQCATGTPSASGVVSGTCAGWPKPSWQSVLGNPQDGVRDTPDVSLFAADGLWSHFYIFCWSDTANGGSACGSDPSAWSGAGGTSFASPIMAGIQALINQKAGGSQGNPAPVYYQLAAAEYGSTGNGSCNSSNGTSTAGTCIFYDVTLGDIDVDCVGPNCYLGGGAIGVLSTSSTAFLPAYGTNTGWDFATGIGTVNAANLVNNWPAFGPNFSLSASPTSLTMTQGASGSTTITVNPMNSFTGNVSLSVSGLPSGVTASFNPSSTATTSTLTVTSSATAAIGSVTLTVTGSSGTLTSQTSITLIVNPTGSFALSASSSSLTILQGASGTSTITVSPQNGFNGSVSLSASGLPSGVTASFNPSSTTSASTLTLTASSTAATGTVVVTVTGASGNLSNTTTLSLTVNAPPNYTVSSSPNSLTIAQGASGTSTITITPQNGFTGTVSLSASGLPSGVTALFNPSSTTSTSTLTLTATGTATTGTVTVTITGTSGSLTKTTSITLTVRLAPTLPSVWTDGDIGSTGVAGSAGYANNVFTVSGAGAQIYGTADAFHFVYQPLSGDGTIVARLVSVQGGSGYVSPGVMIRETLNAGATNAATVDWSAYGTIYSAVRTSTGGSTSLSGGVSATLPYWVKVSRSGNTFSSYTSLDGMNWTQRGTSQTISMAQNVYVGLAVNSGSTSAAATATFDNVSVSSASAPAPVISGVSATTGSVGSAVVISGMGFGASQGNSVVRLNGMAVPVNTWSGTSISMTIPVGASSGPLVVSVAPGMNDSNPVVFTVTSQPLPSPWVDQDVGSVGVVGSASYANGVFTVKGAGAQIYGTADAFHFVYQPLSGDGTLVARLVSVQGGSGYVSPGVMMRETLNAGATNAGTVDWAAYGTIYFEMRGSTGGSTSLSGGVGATLPYWVKVSRSGSTFSSYTSSDGVTWTQRGSQTISMGQTVYVGLAVNSGSASAVATATFDNVSISIPAPPPPNFSLSASPSSMSIVQGASGTSTITVSPQNGFNSSVSLSASGLPSGMTASFNPTSTTSASTLTLTASNAAATGTFTLTITGVSGSLTNTRTLSLAVSAPPNYTVSASPNSLTIAQGASGTSTITITPQNGFNGTVSLSASGLPSGVTASFTPSSTTSTSTLTLTASATATTGKVTVTITGISGSLTNTTTVSLTVHAVNVPTLPSVWTDGDIGSTGVAGSADYANNVFTVSGAGAQIYGTADAFHFVYQPLSGDGTIVARLVSVQGGSGYVSPGVMIRETLNAGAMNATTVDWSAYGTIYSAVRTSTGGSTSLSGGVSATLPYWVKVSRSGNTFSSYTSLDGVNWTQRGTSQTISMAQNVYVGLAVNSGGVSALATATFDNVSVSSASAPAPVISGVSATTGSVGSAVVISGTGFGASQGNSVVRLNGMAVPVNTWSGTSISMTIPVGASSGPLVVSVAPGMNDSNPVVFTVTSQPLPSPWVDQDVGSVGVVGSASYANGVFTVKGAGAQIYGTADAFHFVYQPLSGDGTLVARLVSVQGGSGYVSPGVMMRETLNAGATNAGTVDWAAYGTIYFEMRGSTGGSTSLSGGVSATLPYWVKVSRSGSTFSSYTSSDGATWTQRGSQTISMGQTVYVGLAVNSGSASAAATATFDNVSISTP